MSGHVIIIPPGFRATRQLRVGRRALKMIGAGFMASLCAVFAFGYTFPPAIADTEFDRMRAENQALRIEHENVDGEARRLRTQVARMEQISSKITRELSAD
jgi:hypothetical protein